MSEDIKIHNHQLFKAIERDDPVAVAQEIALGANIAFLRNTGHSPLTWACLRGARQAVEALVEAGADMDGYDGMWRNALEACMLGDHPKTLRWLLKRGANPNAADRWGRTALMLAARRGEISTVRMLLDAGANPNAVDEDGFGALFDAITEQSLACVKALLAVGVDPNAKSASGETPLMRAAVGEGPAFVEAMIEAGADLDAQDQQGETALSLARLECKEENEQTILRSLASREGLALNSAIDKRTLASAGPRRV